MKLLRKNVQQDTDEQLAARYDEWFKVLEKPVLYPKNSIRWDNERMMEYSETLKYLKDIDKNSKILDLGCLYGLIMVNLYELGFKNLSGVDVSTTAINGTIANFKNRGYEYSELVTGIFEDATFKDALFDVIVCLETMEHIRDLDIFIKRVADNIKPDGLFLGSVPFAEDRASVNHIWSFEVADILKLLKPYFRNTEVRRLQNKDRKNSDVLFWAGIGR